MGIEGQKSPRDVASKNEKHPWEIFPEGESSAKDGRKKRKKEHKKAGKFIGWLKTHIILSAGIVCAVIAVVVISIALIKHFTKNDVFVTTGDGGANGTIVPDPGILELDNLPAPELSWTYMVKYFDPILEEGIFTSGQVDETKVEDNLEIYLKKVESDYDKTFYRIYTYHKIAALGFGERAEALMKLFDEENHKLDRTQRYLYLLTYEMIYYKVGNEEKHAEYTKLLDEEYPEDEFYYDVDTGQVLVINKDEEGQTNE